MLQTELYIVIREMDSKFNLRINSKLCQLFAKGRRIKFKSRKMKRDRSRFLQLISQLYRGIIYIVPFNLCRTKDDKVIFHPPKSF